MPTNNIDNVRSDCTSGSVFSLTGKNQKILQVRQVSNYRQSPSFTVCMHNQVLHWDACLRVLHPSVHAIPPAGWGRRRKWLLYVYLTLPSWQRIKKKTRLYGRWLWKSSTDKNSIVRVHGTRITASKLSRLSTAELCPHRSLQHPAPKAALLGKHGHFFEELKAELYPETFRVLFLFSNILRFCCTKRYVLLLPE